MGPASEGCAFYSTEAREQGKEWSTVRSDSLSYCCLENPSLPCFIKIELRKGGARFQSQLLGGRASGITLSLRSAWSIYRILGQPVLHSEALSPKMKESQDWSLRNKDNETDVSVSLLRPKAKPRVPATLGCILSQSRCILQGWRRWDSAAVGPSSLLCCLRMSSLSLGTIVFFTGG